MAKNRAKNQNRKTKVLYLPTKKIGYIFDYAINYYHFPVYFENRKMKIANFGEIQILNK